MDRREYNARWRSRERRYPNWLPLPEGVSVHIHVDPEYAETFSGQVAAFTAASILSRMSLSVAVTVPSIPVIAPLPWRGSKLDEAVMTVLAAAHPDGNYEQRLGRPDDRKIVIGPQGDGLVAHGFGWGAYCGASPSPFGGSSPDALNPFGAAFSVILAASLIQLYPESTKVTSRVVDTYSWKAGFPGTATEVRPKFKVGEIWSIGVGSVGSCALFFLSLVTDAFQAMRSSSGSYPGVTSTTFHAAATGFAVLRTMVGRNVFHSMSTPSSTSCRRIRTSTHSGKRNSDRSGSRCRKPGCTPSVT